MVRLALNYYKYLSLIQYLLILSLTSLQYIDLAPHHYAIRFYSGKVQIDNIQTINKKPFYLLNLPYFLIGELERYIDWFIKQVGR